MIKNSRKYYDLDDYSEEDLTWVPSDEEVFARFFSDTTIYSETDEKECNEKET